jgi:hypothetical protein
MSVPRVFIPQIVKRFDQVKRVSVDVHDFTPAEVFGQLEIVLDENDDPTLISRMVPKVEKKLSDFSPDDFFLAVGSPVLIGVCCGVILRQNRRMKMLTWVREMKTYVQSEIVLSR